MTGGICTVMCVYRFFCVLENAHLFALRLDKWYNIMMRDEYMKE